MTEIRTYKHYTKEENDYIKENYKKVTLQEMARTLCRTDKQIKTKLNSMGISLNDVKREPKPDNGYKCNNKRCKRCKYVSSIGSGIVVCDYNGMMWESRGCPAGIDCIRFTPKKGRG